MLRVMTWISLRLGRRAGRVVLHPIAAYFLLFAPASRRASRNYLRRALGRPPRWRDLYRHFFTFAATIHDRVYLVNHRFELFDFEVHGEDTLLAPACRRQRLVPAGRAPGQLRSHPRDWAGRTRNFASPWSCTRRTRKRSTPCWLRSIRRRCRISLRWDRSIPCSKLRERLDEGCAVGMLAIALRATTPCTRCKSSALTRTCPAGRCAWPHCCGVRWYS